MMRVLALALLALAGCAGPIPVYLSGPFGTAPISDPPEDVRAILDGGFGFWGLEYELVDESPSADVWGPYGSIDLTLVEIPDTAPVRGSANVGTVCRPRVWVDLDEYTLAHEIGHVLIGREHSGAPANIMSTDAGLSVTDVPDVTDGQLEDAAEGAALFLACADGA